MKLTGHQDAIINSLLDQCPTAQRAVLRCKHIRGQLLLYQALALYALANKCNYDGANILEIGTLVGYSTSITAEAAPKAKIVTLNPAHNEANEARKNLKTYNNIRVLEYYSWDYLNLYDGREFDMIFVDGNHNQILRDLPWFNHLRNGGLMLFHDYSPTRSRIVYDVLNDWAIELKRKFDIYLFDNDQNGMVGFYKRDGEKWPTPQQPS